MKIQSDAVLSFLQQLSTLVLDIKETINMGDDGFEDTIKYQVDGIVRVIDVFRVEQCTPLTPVVNKKLRYLASVEGMDLNNIPDDQAYQANTDIYQARLYAFLKRELTNIDLSEIKNEELGHYIEGCVCGTAFEKSVYSQQWMYTSLQVMDDIRDEIIEQRKKAPQSKLF